MTSFFFLLGIRTFSSRGVKFHREFFEEMAQRARAIVNNLLTSKGFIEALAAVCDRRPCSYHSMAHSSTHQTTVEEVYMLIAGLHLRAVAPITCCSKGFCQTFGLFGLNFIFLYKSYIYIFRSYCIFTYSGVCVCILNGP